LASRGPVGRLAVAQKLFNFSTLRGGKGAAETGAFQRRGGGSEAQRARHILFFRNGERKRAMEYVARPQRVDGVLISISKDTTNYEHFESLRRQKIPMVFLDRIPKMPDIHYIASSLGAGMQQAIDFLISQQPQKQAYQGIKLFYDHLILKKPIASSYFLPLDIVMKTNIDYYRFL